MWAAAAGAGSAGGLLGGIGGWGGGRRLATDTRDLAETSKPNGLRRLCGADTEATVGAATQNTDATSCPNLFSNEIGQEKKCTKQRKLAKCLFLFIATVKNVNAV